MDPETLRDLEESLRQLSEVLDRQSTALSDYNTATSNAKTAVGNNTASVNSANTANNQVVQGMTRYAQTVSELDAEIDKQNKLFGQQLKNAGRATLNFGKALVSAETSLTKYGSSANQLGDVAWDVGKNFGLFGKVIGGVLKGLGLAANSILTLNQNIISFRDDFTKQAGVLPITTSELSNLAKEAGFAYNRMPMLSKAVTSLGENLLSLGGNAGEGAVRFMNIANVGSDTRERFRRMGLQQEDLLEYQTYYIELQKAGGQAQANRRKTDDQIQRESLEYADNLLLLSALTGEKASAIKDEQSKALLVQEEQQAVLAENAQIAELREKEKQGDKEAGIRANAIQDEQKKRQEMIAYLATTVGEEEAFAVGSLRRTQGAYTAKTAKYSQIQLAQLELAYRNSNQSAEDKAKLRDAIVAEQTERSRTYAQQVQLVGKEAQDLTTQGQVATEKALRLGSNITEATAIAERQRNEAKEPGRDPLMDAATSIQELEIEASKKFQDFLEIIDPFGAGLENLKNAAIAAAAVLSGGALIAGVAKLIGGKFGKIGSPGNPMYAKVVPGPTGTVGGIGAKLKSIFKRSAAPAAAAAGVAPIAAAGPLAASGAGAAAIAGPAGSPGGSKVGMFLMGIAKGLGAFGAGSVKIGIGAGVLAGAITVIGAAVAVSTVLIGSALPSLAKGLTTFDKVDGDNLQKLGTGMAGMAAGLIAIGGSKISDAMGSFVKWASGNDSNPIDNLQTELTKFQNLEVKPEKIEKNSKAFIAFNKMVAQATEINGTVAGALARAFGSFFEVPIPIDKFKDFSDLDIDPEKAGKNATAFKLFAEAMSSYKGYGTISSLGMITRLLGGSVFSFFQSLPTDDPIKRFEDFSKVPIKGDQIKINANAFKDFANAMAEYKGGPGVFEAISQLAGAKMMTIFGADGPVEAFAKFAREDFGPNMEKNADAFTKYANAATKGGGGASGSSPASTGDGGGSSSGGATQSGGAVTNDQVGLGDGSKMKSDGETTADSGSSSKVAEPNIGSGKEAILNYAKTLSPAEKAAFFKKLSQQGMEKAQAAGAAGNQAAANAFLDSANRFYTISQSSELLSQTGGTIAGETWKTTGQGYVYPVPEGRDTSAYGYRTHPVKGGRRFHTGLDVGKGKGSPIIAAQDGKIIRTSYDTSPYKGFGQIAIQDHGDGLQSIYAHLDKYSVREGDVVNKGRQIGTMGSTGMSTGPHLHYILQKSGGFSVPNKANTIDPKTKITEKPKAKAEKGGIFTGFDSVFSEGMAEAQKIGALDPSSLIAKMGKTSVQESSTLPQEEVTTPEIDLTPELLSMMENKLEKVLTALENNQSTHERILKNSM
jgi:murein DD-endopeptidase MepM/ murein hydrolase activator NlpD